MRFYRFPSTSSAASRQLAARGSKASIARLTLSGVPLHVVQRGNNRQACFFHIADYQFYLETAIACAMRYHVDIHAYVLMTNHVHLLLTPADKWGVSRMVQLWGAT